ncbi:2411_t:CDS:2, partial [Dentiscutata heterogama]
MINLRGEYINDPISLKFRILYTILWLSPAFGVLIAAILIESIVEKTACQNFGVSASLAHASQIQSRLINIGNRILFKDIASWASLNSPLDLFKTYKSGSLSLWRVLAGLIATILNASSRLTYTIGDVSLGVHDNVVQTKSLLKGTICGALSSSQNATSDGSYKTQDGFTIFTTPSFYGSGTTTIKDSLTDKVFVLVMRSPTASVNGYYTICNATAKTYDVTAHATSNDTWEETSMVKNLDTRLVFTEGDLQQNGSIIPYSPTGCTNCDFIGTEN